MLSNRERVRVGDVGEGSEDMGEESEDVRDFYITKLIVHNAIKVVWGEGRSPLMSSCEQRTHVNQAYEAWHGYTTLL